MQILRCADIVCVCALCTVCAFVHRQCCWRYFHEILVMEQNALTGSVCCCFWFYYPNSSERSQGSMKAETWLGFLAHSSQVVGAENGWPDGWRARERQWERESERERPIRSGAGPLHFLKAFPTRRKIHLLYLHSVSLVQYAVNQEVWNDWIRGRSVSLRFPRPWTHYHGQSLWD